MEFGTAEYVSPTNFITEALVSINNSTSLRDLIEYEVTRKQGDIFYYCKSYYEWTWVTKGRYMAMVQLQFHNCKIDTVEKLEIVKNATVVFGEGPLPDRGVVARIAWYMDNVPLRYQRPFLQLDSVSQADEGTY